LNQFPVPIDEIANKTILKDVKEKNLQMRTQLGIAFRKWEMHNPYGFSQCMSV